MGDKNIFKRLAYTAIILLFLLLFVLDGLCQIDASAPLAQEGVKTGIHSFLRAGEFGILPYNELVKLTRGSGLEVHHLIEKRFAAVFGTDSSSMLAIALTPEEHRVFTNAWRSMIPYGQGTANATEEIIMNAARMIYRDYPDILLALDLFEPEMD